MLLRRFTDFILRNPLNAIGLAAVMAFIPVIYTASILIALFITLRKSVVEGFVVLLAAILPIFIDYFTHPSSWKLMLIMVAFNVLAWLFAVMLRRFQDWSLLLELGALVAIIIVVLLHLNVGNLQGWWDQQFLAYAKNAVAKVAKKDPIAAKVTYDQFVIFASKMKLFATGFMAFCVLGMIWMQLVVARWWQAIIFNPGGLKKELYNIRFHYLAGIVFLLVMIGSLLGNVTALDVMPILIGVFFLAGLSLCHYTAARLPRGSFLLAAIYLGFILYVPIAIIISILALFDVALDFRKRFNRKMR